MVQSVVLVEVLSVGGDMSYCSSHEEFVKDLSAAKSDIGYLKNKDKEQDARIESHKKDRQRELDEHKLNESSILSDINIALKEIKDAILGTTEKKGLKTLVMEHEDFIRPQRDSLNGLINWIYKGMMVAGMICLLYLVGFKHIIE